jgi:hypothetical protein
MKPLIFLTVLFSLFLFSFGQAEKAGTFGTADSEWFEVSHPTLDGGWIVGGVESEYLFIISNGVDYERGVVVKLDSAGLAEWAYWLERGDSYVYVDAVTQAQDGSYFVLADFYASDSYYPCILLVKLDGSGNEVWQKSFFTGTYSYGNDVCPTTDGGVVVAGVTYNSYYNGDEMLVMKLGANGNIEWQAKYGQYRNWAYDQAARIIQTGDGGYLVVGTTSYNNYWNSGGNHDDVEVMRLNAQGQILWQRSYGTTDYEDGVDVVDAGDGGFLVIAGNRYVGFNSPLRQRGQAPSDQSNWVFKIDGSGNILWQRRYGEGMVDYFTRACRLDTGYLLSGTTMVTGAEGIQGRITMIDDNGLLQWQKSYGGNDDEAILGVLPLNERQLMAVGITNSFGSGGVDGLVMILSNEGNIASSCTESGFIIQDIPDTSAETAVVPFESKLRRKVSEVLLNNNRVTLVPCSQDESLICERIKK